MIIIYICIYNEAVSNVTRKYKSFELAVNASKKSNKLAPSEKSRRNDTSIFCYYADEAYRCASLIWSEGKFRQIYLLLNQYERIRKHATKNW